MFSKEGLITNVLLAAIAGSIMNIAIYQLLPEDVPKKEDRGFWCGTSSLYPPLSTLALEGKEIFNANCITCHAMHEKVVG